MSPRKKSNKKVGIIKHGEVWGIVLVALAVFVFASLVSYDPLKNPLINSDAAQIQKAPVGIVGIVVSYYLYLAFGAGAFAISVCALGFGTALILKRPIGRVWLKLVYLFIILITLCSILQLQTSFTFGRGYSFLRKIPGGIIGSFLAGTDGVLIKYLGHGGTAIIMIFGFLISAILATRVEVLPILRFMARVLNRTAALTVFVFRKLLTRKVKPVKIVKPDSKSKQKKKSLKKPKPEQIYKPPPRKIVVATTKHKAPVESAKAPFPIPKIPPGKYVLPSLDLLDDPPKVSTSGIYDDIHKSSEILEKTLRNFGIEATVGEIHRGPVITRYEIHLAPGIKVQKVTALADDIALSMKSHGVRIVAPIFGKAAVGIEIPNSKPTIVCLKETFTSDGFKKSKAKIPIAVGKSISGKVVVSDLADMPHLLIAGATGSGKSVCINSIIMTLVFNMKPSELKLLLVDPKKIELSEYNRLPHLLIPVITNPKKVATGLNWLVMEMEKRYDYLSQVGSRNIESYNSRPIERKSPKKTSEEEEEIPDRLPYIIVIIDELADLMMVSPVDVEQSIMRLAQLSRAVGIHLILSTQRPSVNVITGVIKANFPARISFQVATKVDSRTVIDSNGAETLVGNGDLLFLPPGTSRLIRAQGTYVNDKEISRVLKFIKSQAEPRYDTTILVGEERERKAGEMIEDDLFDDAVDVVLRTRQASASNLQRRMRIGYARAARIIDMMEDRGIIGPSQGSRPREILVTTAEAEGHSI